MIYYNTQPIDLTDNEATRIDDAIKRGLDALSVEAGRPVILTDIIPVDAPVSGSVFLIILAKPYDASALTINEVRKSYSLEQIDEILKPYMGEI